MSIRTTLKAAMAAATIASLLAPIAVGAATLTAKADSDLVVGQATFRVMRGSTYDSLEVKDGALKVTVPASEAFEVRTVGPVYGIENDAGQATCDVISERVNRMMLYGPITATLRPSTTPCSTSGASTDKTPLFAFSAPTAGAVVKAGNQLQAFWSLNGRPVSSIRVRASRDGGATFPTTLVDGGYNYGYLNWNVPADTVSTTTARLKIEGMDSGRIVTFAVSELFTIDGVAAPVIPEPSGSGSLTVAPYDYEVATELSEASTISIDRHLNFATVGTPVCVAETRIKVKGMDAVYYCGRNGKRYVFPNKKTHDTWYSNFNGVVELELSEMQQIPLGGNVTYRPGARLVKITTAPEVFAVAADGILRHVTEAQAVRLYGADWAKQVDDIPDAFFSDYVIGEPLK